MNNDVKKIMIDTKIALLEAKLITITNLLKVYERQREIKNEREIIKKRHQDRMALKRKKND